MDSFIYHVEEKCHDVFSLPFKSTVHRRFGERHGLCCEYYVLENRNIQKSRETRWRYGKRLSTVVYRDNGCLWVVYDFTKGTEVVYHENGKIKETSQFVFVEFEKDGTRFRFRRTVGDHKEFDHMGKLVSECTYENGKPWCMFEGQIVHDMRVGYRSDAERSWTVVNSANMGDGPTYPIDVYEEMCDKYRC